MSVLFHGGSPGADLRLLLDVALPIFDETMGPRRCLNATAVSVAALGAMGVEARPISVGLFVANGVYRSKLASVELPRGGVPVDRDLRAWIADGAWALAVDEAAPPEDGDEWNGHLVVHAQGWVLDVASGGFCRPKKDILVPGAVTFRATDRFLLGEERICVDLEGGAAASYHVRPSDVSWMAFGGAHLTRENVGLVNRIVDEVATRRSGMVVAEATLSLGQEAAMERATDRDRVERARAAAAVRGGVALIPSAGCPCHGCGCTNNCPGTRVVGRRACAWCGCPWCGPKLVKPKVGQLWRIEGRDRVVSSVTAEMPPGALVSFVDGGEMFAEALKHHGVMLRDLRDGT